MLAGLVKNPTGYDPTNYPDRALERRDVVLDRMAELNVDPAREGREEQGQGPRARRAGRRQRLRELRGAVLLRLRHRVAAPGPAARRRPSRSGATCSRTAASRSRPRSTWPTRTPPTTRSRRTSSPRTRRSAPWRWSSPAPATSARSPSRGRWAATRKEGETYLNYMVPEEFGDSKCCQAGLDVQGVHARCGDRAGPPADHVVRCSELADDVRLRRLRQLPRRARASATAPSRCRTRPASGNMNLYSGTRLSVNTFYMQLEQDDRRLRALRARQGDGRQPDQPASATRRARRGADPQLHPRRGEREPAGDGRGLRHLRRPRPALHARARSPRSSTRRGNVLKDYPAQCHQVMEQPTADAVNDVLRGVIEGGFAAAQALGGPGGRQDRHHQRRQVGLVHRLHPAPGRGRDDRRRQPVRHADRADRPDHRRQLHLPARPAPASRHRSGATRCG